MKQVTVYDHNFLWSSSQSCDDSNNSNFNPGSRFDSFDRTSRTVQQEHQNSNDPDLNQLRVKQQKPEQQQYRPTQK